MSGVVIISAAVEGIVDQAVAQRLINTAGGCPGTIYGKNGKEFLRKKIGGFNNAAQLAPWLVLVDLDHDAECAPPFCRQWLPQPALQMCFRVAVRQVEAWLLADAESLAPFLSVRPNRIPAHPEQLEDSKQEMVNLARYSRRQAIKKDMVPREGSGRSVGPAYASRLIEYIQNFWNPIAAGKRAESLARAITDLERVVKKHASHPK